MIAHGPPVLRSGITPRLEIAGDESVSRRAAVPCGKYDLVKKLNGGLDTGGGSHGPSPSRRMARKETGGNIGKALFPTPPPFPKRRGQFSLPSWITRGPTGEGGILEMGSTTCRESVFQYGEN